jgi:hypothetical protein
MVNSQATCKAFITTEQYFGSCKTYEVPGNAVAHPIINLPRGVHFGLDIIKNSLINSGFIEYVKHPQKMMQQLPAHNISDDNFHSPKIYHGLWLTSKNNPREINYQVENFIKQAQKLPGYEIIMWTNIDKEVFSRLNPVIVNANITIKNIADLKTSYSKLLDLALSPAKYLPTHNAKLFNGVLIDLTKYLIMESEGGILADLNFEFAENFNPNNIAPYDFIAPTKAGSFIENGYFIAKAHHIIFQELLNYLDDVMFSGDCGLTQFKNAAALFNTDLTNFFSMAPLDMSYMMYNNKQGNFDGLVKGCTNHKNDKQISPYLWDEIHAHEEFADYIDNATTLEQVNSFIVSYCKVFQDFFGKHIINNFNCVDTKLIGLDGIGSTWQSADIVSN